MIFFFQILIDYDIKFQYTKESLYDRYPVFVELIDDIFSTDLADPKMKKIFAEYRLIKSDMSDGNFCSFKYI